MRKGLTELVFILDRSGSMGGLEKDTIGGFNGMMEKQRRQEGEANITTVLFDDQYELVHDRVPVGRVKPLTERDYYVRGCTALLDAVGKTIRRMGLIQKHLPGEWKAEKVIFVITTDGLENASREYDYGEIRRMIERQKSRFGWEFLFLGANMDAVAEAQKFGIGEARSVTFENDSDGIAVNYRALDQALCYMRSAPCMAAMDRSWKAEIEENTAACVRKDINRGRKEKHGKRRFL